jgi:hypothetical protein
MISHGLEERGKISSFRMLRVQIVTQLKYEQFARNRNHYILTSATVIMREISDNHIHIKISNSNEIWEA